MLRGRQHVRMVCRSGRYRVLIRFPVLFHVLPQSHYPKIEQLYSLWDQPGYNGQRRHLMWSKNTVYCKRPCYESGSVCLPGAEPITVIGAHNQRYDASVGPKCTTRGNPRLLG